MPLMYGRSEKESAGPTEALRKLSDLASLLLPVSGESDVPLESKSDEAGTLARTASLAPWTQQRKLKREIVLVQGPPGSGKSLFVWSLYSRFGESLWISFRLI